MIKKLLYLTIIIASCFCVTACGCSPYEIYVEGIDNFSIADSSTSLNQRILPSEEFLETYEYISAEYFYRDTYKTPLSVESIEQSIVIVTYDSNNYELAKSFCFDSMELSDTNQCTYNNYVFVENVALFKARNEATDYPYWFNMFVYNDNEKCLLFMGYSASVIYHEQAGLATENWGEFLDKYYGDFYNFD